MVVIMSAAASRTCSQLSNNRSRDLPSKAAATLSATLRPGCWVMPSAVATASGTAAGSPTAASSVTNTPSWNVNADRAANSNARRVLPTPPTPVSVTNRCALSAVSSSARSASRPTKLVVGGRRFPGVGSTVFNGGNSVRSPSALTWKTSTGLAISRNRFGPNEIRSMPLIRPAVAPSSRTCPPCPAAITRAVRLSTVPK